MTTVSSEQCTCKYDKLTGITLIYISDFYYDSVSIIIKGIKRLIEYKNVNKCQIAYDDDLLNAIEKYRHDYYVYRPYMAKDDKEFPNEAEKTLVLIKKIVKHIFNAPEMPNIILKISED